MLSIITVVFNDKVGLYKTIRSVFDQKKYYNNLEFIVIDGGSTDGTLDIIKQNNHVITKYISEKDDGIYDAMNKGIKLAQGDYLLFLNAGDYFVGNVLSTFISGPVYLPVKYMNIFTKYITVKIKNIKRSIPNCHQGIIFENKHILYDIQFPICSDYDFFLRLYKKTLINRLITEGYIHFDSNGISSHAISARNKEMYILRKKHFDLFTASLYFVIDSMKRVVKMILKRK